MLHELVRFTRLEKTYVYLPGMSAATAAAHFGMDEAAYQDTRNRFGEKARGAAGGLRSSGASVPIENRRRP
jgi:hypothetical protein